MVPAKADSLMRSSMFTAVECQPPWLYRGCRTKAHARATCMHAEEGQPRYCVRRRVRSRQDTALPAMEMSVHRCAWRQPRIMSACARRPQARPPRRSGQPAHSGRCTATRLQTSCATSVSVCALHQQVSCAFSVAAFSLGRMRHNYSRSGACLHWKAALLDVPVFFRFA